MIITTDVTTILQKAVNKHFNDNKTENVTLIVMNQKNVKYENISHLLKISFFGPFIQDLDARFQLQLLCVVAQQDNLYDITNFTDDVMAMASKGLYIPEYLGCIKVESLSVIHLDRVEMPMKGVATIITGNYSFELNEQIEE